MLTDREEGFLKVPVVAQVNDQAAGRVLSNPCITSAQNGKPVTFLTRVHGMKLNELLKKIIFKRAGALRIDPGAFFDHRVQLAVTVREV